MNKINVIPLVQVNDIRFGMSRSEVRAILGEACEFSKTVFDSNLTDDFGYCHVFYDDNDKCEAIEIFSDAEVYIDNKLIFPTTKEAVIKLFKDILDDLIQDEEGFISYKYSIGIYAPDEDMESILIGTKNYYDSCIYE